MSGIVFLSGGTALRGLAREFARRKIPTTHIITTFDSGGSSHALRQAFSMPAPGDIRNRLLALADTDITPESVLSLLNTRLPRTFASPNMILSALASACPALPAQYRRHIEEDLRHFLHGCPASFDARYASIGNMAITGAYLRKNRNLGVAVERYAALLHILGRVLPISEDNLQLCAILADGRHVIGQNFFGSLPAPVRRIYLAASDGRETKAQPCPAVLDALADADVICYSMGSFYSSLLVNLLPDGVGRAVAKSAALKLFVPDTGFDPELSSLDLPGQAHAIIAALQADAPNAEPASLLNATLIDAVRGEYIGGWSQDTAARLQAMGIKPYLAPVVNAHGTHDAAALADAFMELAS